MVRVAVASIQYPQRMEYPRRVTAAVDSQGNVTVTYSPGMTEEVRQLCNIAVQRYGVLPEQINLIHPR